MVQNKLIKAGDILIAEPFLPDPNFSRKVVYITEHNSAGTIGFVLNKPLGLTLKDVIQTGPSEDLDLPLFSGGPVGNDTLHVIHQLGDLVTGSKYIAKHTYWGGDFEQIKLYLLNKNVDWRDVRFFIGYSGWSPGQLEDEILNKSWIKHRAKDELLFNNLGTKVWEDAMNDKGGRYKLFTKSPKSPDWN